MPRKSTKALRRRAPLQDDPRGQFDLFPKLPENIRLNIWRHASFVPRVVDVFESHDIIEIDEDSEDSDGSDGSDDGEDSEDSDDSGGGEDSGDGDENEDTENSVSSEDSYDSEDYEDHYDEKKVKESSGVDVDKGEKEADLRKQEDSYRKAGMEAATIMYSKTRPPAVLSVCREARAHGLTIYKAIDAGIRTKHPKFSQHDIPIYVNPEVDVIYRSKIACEKGDAFRVRCRIWATYSEPVVFTPTLAVDLIALSQPRDLIQRDFLFLYDHLKTKEQRDDRFKQMFKLGSKPEIQRFIVIQELSRCVERGLRNLIIVVGNEDEMSEITLVPVERDTAQDPRIKGAFYEADRLRTDLEKYWEEECNGKTTELVTMALPNIQIMTVKRTPLKFFGLFSKLPPELQDMVWHFALHTPRVISLAQHLEDYFNMETYFASNSRPPALLGVCRASRQVVLKTAFQTLPPKLHRTQKYRFYNPFVDTVRMEPHPLRDAKDFAKYNIKSLGITFKPSDDRISPWMFTGRDAKAFIGLEEIVILIGGRSRGDCQMTPRPVTLDAPILAKMSIDHRSELRSFVARLMSELSKVSRNWKAYQRRRLKQGKASPDWVMPTVRVAVVQEDCQTESPYLYKHRSNSLDT